MTLLSQCSTNTRCLCSLHCAISTDDIPKAGTTSCTVFEALLLFQRLLSSHTQYSLSLLGALTVLALKVSAGPSDRGHAPVRLIDADGHVATSASACVLKFSSRPSSCQQLQVVRAKMIFGRLILGFVLVTVAALFCAQPVEAAKGPKITNKVYFDIKHGDKDMGRSESSR